MKSFNAEDVVKKIYDSLFSSIGDVDLEKLEGNWYTVGFLRNAQLKLIRLLIQAMYILSHA